MFRRKRPTHLDIDEEMGEMIFNIYSSDHADPDIVSINVIIPVRVSQDPHVGDTFVGKITAIRRETLER